MNNNYDAIWRLALPYLKQGLMKDFVVHTQGVVRAMEMILEGEGGNPDILIPAAILHDVGFSKVDKELQTNADLEQKREAQRQHLIHARKIIEEILGEVGYDNKEIQSVVEIVQSHKFQDPTEKAKQLLIDADNLSDVFKEQFSSDAQAYGCTPEQLYKFRVQNTYYTQTAKKIFKKELAMRAKEIK